MKKQLPDATVTLRNVPKMSKRNITRLANWLRLVADNMEKEGSNYHSVFTSKFFFPPSWK